MPHYIPLGPEPIEPFVYPFLKRYIPEPLLPYIPLPEPPEDYKPPENNNDDDDNED